MKKKAITIIIMMALVPVLFFSCERKSESEENSLYIFNWTYYTPDSVIAKFEEEYNVKVTYDEFASNEDMYAKIKAVGGGYDIIFPSVDYVTIMIQQGMLEKIDKTKLSNLGNIDPVIVEKMTYDPGMDYSVPYYYGAAGIIVNTARVPDFEPSWSIFENTSIRNRMTMLDDMREVIGGALLFLGHSANTKNPDEIIAARDLINDKWKPNLAKFDAETFGKSYERGDFWVVHGYPEVVFEEIEGNDQLIEDTVFFIPKEGGPSYIDSMCILKGSKNINLAHKFIDFIHRPDIYAEFADAFGFPATVNIPARDLQTVDPMYTVEDLENTYLVEDLGPALELYNDAWFDSIRVD